MSLSFNPVHIMQGDKAQLDALYAGISIPSQTQQLRAEANSTFFSHLFGHQTLDAELTPIIAQLKNIFMSHADQHPDFYCDAKHPLRKLFDYLLTHAATWYPRDAKPNQLLFEKLIAITQNIADWNAQPDNILLTQHVHAALDDLQEWSAAEDRRATLLEKRLCETELNSFKLIDAECKVLMLINSSLAHKFFPSEIITGVTTTLKSELQHCVITENTDTSFWKIWTAILPVLGRLFPEEETHESDQFLYKQAPIILQQLERSLTFTTSNPDLYRRLVDGINASLMFAIQKQSQACEMFKPLPYPEGYIDTDTRIVGAVLQQSDNLQEGDWILFSAEDNHIIRCKLALKNSVSGQLLYVDRTGRKVMLKNTKDFSLCLSTGIAKPLIFTNQADEIKKYLQQLIALSEKNRAIVQQQAKIELDKKINEQEEKKREAEKARLLAEEQKHQEQLAQQKAAAQKALHEAKLLAEQKKEREHQQLEREQQQQLAQQLAAQQEQQRQRQQQLEAQAAQEQQLANQAATELLKLQFAQQQVQSLNVGAWIEIDSDNQKQRCKLAVVIASAGKYIFVDNLGRKVAEYKREQLVEDYMSNKVLLLHYGDKFEDQLAKVIRGLRKDIS